MNATSNLSPPEIILPGGGVLEGVVILSQLVVVRPQPINLLLTVGVGVDQTHDGVLQLVIEGVTRIVGRVQIVIHGAVSEMQYKVSQGS